MSDGTSAALAWGGWWILFTLLASLSQTARNAMQRSLTSSLGTVGATHVRFLYGFPFALVSLVLVGGWFGWRWPVLVPGFWLWILVGAVTQIAATGLMLATMRERSFVVTTAYIKTEPIQVAVFGLVFLGDRLGVAAITAILVATAGVMVMSWPKPGKPGAQDSASLRPALLGIASGALFAMAAVGFRGAILALGDGPFVLHATVTLACGLLIQTVLLSGWLAWQAPQTLKAVLLAWRRSLPAGFFGAFASQMWFLAFALETAARVRTLGLVEILLAQALSWRVFAQTTTRRDLLGIVLVVAGVMALLLNRV